jgi:hypothetical protein
MMCFSFGRRRRLASSTAAATCRYCCVVATIDFVVVAIVAATGPIRVVVILTAALHTFHKMMMALCALGRGSINGESSDEILRVRQTGRERGEIRDLKKKKTCLLLESQLREESTWVGSSKGFHSAIGGSISIKCSVQAIRARTCNRVRHKKLDHNQQQPRGASTWG